MKQQNWGCWKSQLALRSLARPLEALGCHQWTRISIHILWDNRIKIVAYPQSVLPKTRSVNAKLVISISLEIRQIRALAHHFTSVKVMYMNLGLAFQPDWLRLIIIISPTRNKVKSYRVFIGNFPTNCTKKEANDSTYKYYNIKCRKDRGEESAFRLRHRGQADESRQLQNLFNELKVSDLWPFQLISGIIITMG